MTKVVCYFCGRMASRGKEHVFPRWLVDHLGLRKNLGRHVHRSHAGAELSVRLHTFNSHVFGHVCKDCNAGRLSFLENKAKPAILALLGSQRRLGRTDALALSLWALKTSAVLNGASNYRRLVPREHFRGVREYQMPLGVHVDIGFLDEDVGIGWLQTQQILGLVNPHEAREMARRLATEGYVILLGIRRVAIRVVYLPMPGYSVRTVDPDDERRVCRIWPPAQLMYPIRSRRYPTLQDMLNVTTFEPDRAAA